MAAQVPARVSRPSPGEAVVMLHGFAGTSRAFDAVCRALPPERYRPLALDLPGHGAHGAQSGTIDFAGCVAQVFAASPPHFVLCGYSQGGRVALHVALAAPQRVERLVLVSASAGIEDERARHERLQADERLAGEIERDGLAAFAERWRSQPLFADEPPAVRAQASADHLRNTPQGLAAALRGLGAGSMSPVWGRLSELTMPVTLIAGERDARYCEIARRMATLLLVSELRIVAGGHGLLLENPTAVAAAIAESDHSLDARRPLDV